MNSASTGSALYSDDELAAHATAQDEWILNEKRRHFDACRAPRARLADISLRRFEEGCLPAAVDAETLAGNDRSTEERLAAAKMIVSVDDPVPTVGGILVLGKRPQSDPRRGDARARPGATVRVRHPGGAPASARRRASRAGVPRRSEPGAMYGARARMRW